MTAEPLEPDEPDIGCDGPVLTGVVRPRYINVCVKCGCRAYRVLYNDAEVWVTHGHRLLGGRIICRAPRITSSKKRKRK